MPRKKVEARAAGISMRGRRAAYVAWLLAITPDAIFPFGPECDEEGDSHLDFFVRRVVTHLLSDAELAADLSPEAVRYASTLAHANAVLERQENPASNGWFENRAGYRRGLFVHSKGETSGEGAE